MFECTQVNTTAGDDVSAAILQARTGALRLLLDYDGTLVPLAASPELAAPDARLLRLLDRLAAVRDLTIDLVSGRPRDVLDQWFGHLPAVLWAEHGLWLREVRGGEWQPTVTVEAALLDQVVPLLEGFVTITPGAHLERKSASVAWHYRGAEEAIGSRRADELRVSLGEGLKSLPLEILEGKKVIEVRFRGVTKAIVGQRMNAAKLSSTTIVAFGDDRTDEDLFRALPSSSITVAVGQPLAGARYQLDGSTDVRRILRRLAVPTSTGFAR
jgi:trehalose 6-phosphate synthase/phosphatase